MFLSEKISELRSMGASVAQINKFKDAYSEEMRKGAHPAAAMEFAELTTKKRNDLQEQTFAIPEERKFPLNDKSHAANALARSSGTKYEARVKAAVYKKFPEMKKDN